MYVFELKDVPRRAGEAVLDWDRGVTYPLREKKKIGLPLRKDTEFFSLAGGRQFIVRPSVTERSCWFGGTDEEPFLVEMDVKVAQLYIDSAGDEEEFYRTLVPNSVLAMATENDVMYKRQGDIFASRFSGEKNAERNLARLLKKEVKQGEMTILGTRHVGKGLGFVHDENVFFRGVLVAPDHVPLNLSDGLYLLGQTKYITHPAQAD
ncbi:MAG: hypothetical protein AABW80_02570 [Nanoarchaeota archaeon]